MMLCTGKCDYFHTFTNFTSVRTYKTHKQCRTCNHIVSKEEYPDLRCYCCSAKYRIRFVSSVVTRRDMRHRRQLRQIPILNF